VVISGLHAPDSASLLWPGNNFVVLNSCYGSALDCNDNSSLVYPGAQGTGGGMDNDCDGQLEQCELLQYCIADFNGDGARNVRIFSSSPHHLHSPMYVCMPIWITTVWST